MSTEAATEAIELAASAGLVLDPWQEEELRDALGERADHRWAASRVGLIVPRQNGKGSVIEARELAGLFLFGEMLMLHSAHLFKTAQEAFRRILTLIQNTPDLERRVMRVRTAHGDEGIELRGGQRLNFIARSSGGGRGLGGDLVIWDEAFRLFAEMLEALVPTMSARPNPQTWFTSSAPLEGEESAVLRALCREGRKGGPRLAYREYAADPSADPNLIETVASANPGLHVRVQPEFIDDVERPMLSVEGFARERLGLWDDSEDDDAAVLPARSWAAARDPLSGPVGDRLAFALDVSPARDWASFGVAGPSGREGTHVEVADRRPGTGWVVGRAVELQARWGGPLHVIVGSPAWSMYDGLIAAGVQVEPVTAGEHAQACGQFKDAVCHTVDEVPAPMLRHLGQVELDAAVKGAAQRFAGDSWTWARRSSSTDISPLVAVTVAFRAAQQLSDVTDSIW